MAPPTNAPADVAAWLDDDFIASFERDVDVTIWRPPFVDANGNQHDRGFFAITMLSLAYCEAMTGLLDPQGDGGTVQTCQFIERNVAAAAAAVGHATSAARYTSRGTLLYTLHRHRLVHQREPGQLDLNGTTVSWYMGRGIARTGHMKLSAAAHLPNHRILTIDVESLQADVLATFKAIRADVANGNAALAARIHANATTVYNPQPPDPRLSPNGHVWTQYKAIIAAPPDP
jgi:hypothetical protein